MARTAPTPYSKSLPQSQEPDTPLTHELATPPQNKKTCSPHPSPAYVQYKPAKSLLADAKCSRYIRLCFSSPFLGGGGGRDAGV